MALTVSFGNGASADSLYLDQRDTSGLNSEQRAGGGTVSTTTTANGITISNLDGPVAQSAILVPGQTTGTGGTVSVGYTASDNAFNFTSSGWNAVKNGLATSDEASNVKFTNFVNVNVNFSEANEGDSSVVINNVKRAVVDTGAGNDKVAISLSTNDGNFTNKVLVNTGAGNDTITLTSGQQVGIARETSGRFTDVTIDAGAGDDSINLSGVNLKSALITGGAGNDTFTGSGGADTYVYNAFEGSNSGEDVITNFAVGTDKFQLNGVGFESISQVGRNTIVVLTDDTQITLRGVNSVAFASTLGSGALPTV